MISIFGRIFVKLNTQSLVIWRFKFCLYFPHTYISTFKNITNNFLLGLYTCVSQLQSHFIRAPFMPMSDHNNVCKGGNIASKQRCHLPSHSFFPRFGDAKNFSLNLFSNKLFLFFFVFFFSINSISITKNIYIFK